MGSIPVFSTIRPSSLTGQNASLRRKRHGEFEFPLGLHLFLLRISMTDAQLTKLLSTPFVTEAAFIHQPDISSTYFSCGKLSCDNCSLQYHSLCALHAESIKPNQVDYLKANHPELSV